MHQAQWRGLGRGWLGPPALSVSLHDALEEHGVVLHVGMLGRLQLVEGEEERAAAGHVGLALGPLEGSGVQVGAQEVSGPSSSCVWNPRARLGAELELRRSGSSLGPKIIYVNI